MRIICIGYEAYIYEFCLKFRAMHIVKLLDELDFQNGTTDPNIEIQTNEPIELSAGDKLIDRTVLYTIRSVIKNLVNNNVSTFYTVDITNL